MDLLDQMKHRRSVRSYTGQLIAEEALKKVLQAGLLSASSRSIRPWEFVVVRDRKMLQVLSECRICMGGGLLDCHGQYAFDGGRFGAWQLLDSGKAA